MIAPNRRTLADLTAATFEITSRGIQITPKKKLVEQLGRSPDNGDSIVMAYWNGAAGLKPKSSGLKKSLNTSNNMVNMKTTANIGYSNRRRTR